MLLSFALHAFVLLNSLMVDARWLEVLTSSPDKNFSDAFRRRSGILNLVKRRLHSRSESAMFP
jgi:hypothetical protein